MDDYVACYRSTHPDVIAAWDAYGADHERFARDVAALTDELWPNEVGGHRPEPIVTRSTFDPGKRKLVGWSWPWGVPAPEGWRLEKGPDWTQTITPKRSNKLGKSIAKRLDGVAPVKGADLPGMPLVLMLLPATYSAGVERHGDALFVAWGIDPEQHDPRATPGGKPLDLNIWQRIKTSEFFAARESDLVASES